MSNVKIQSLGYFIKRQDIFDCKLENLLKEIEINLFEAKIMKATIQAILDQKLSAIDSAVGDWKCQTRTSMIADLLENNPFLHQMLLKEISIIDHVILKNKLFLDAIMNSPCLDKKKIEQELQCLSLQKYFQKNNLDCYPSEKLSFLSLCFFLTPENMRLSIFTEHRISKNKLKILFNLAKKSLCDASISYEENLAQKYGTLEEQKSLSQIENKEIQYMTSLFCSFKSIYKKMKQTHQSFLKKTILFCVCNGVKKISIKMFGVINNKFTEIPLDIKSNQTVMVFQGYQYPGSLAQLKQALRVPVEEVYISQKYYRVCLCVDTIAEKSFDDIEETMLAFFAQHPQFTNEAEIDFEKLGLLGTTLHKEYMYLKSLAGVSMNDMSKFYIDHVYPSIIKEALRDDGLVPIIPRRFNNITHHDYAYCFC